MRGRLVRIDGANDSPQTVTGMADNGSIVVALVDENEVTLKRIRRKGDSIALEPANNRYETRIFGPDRVRVTGARGKPRPETLKATVCIDSGLLAITGGGLLLLTALAIRRVLDA